MTHAWYEESVFYHIYPLGFCGAPEHNDYHSQNKERLFKICEWIPHMKALGINTVYLGPIFESESHGYDTVNYFELDRRLGTNETLKQLIKHLHQHDIRVVLDGVFNHVSRDFFAFQDLQQHQQHSIFTEWFCEINFQQRSPFGDPFSYEGWNDHFNLVKLNVTNPQVEEHLFKAVRLWIEEFEIDGLRLDVADVLNKQFMKRLASYTKKIKKDFWLMGEVIHGDYTQWANPDMLHATTNYECYKGLYSSHNDHNYFEIAYSLNRLFNQEHGIYRGLYLYNFADNHDVNRVASTLHDPAHLYPLYILLFTIPGVPSLYYGSEWGLEGERQHNSDHNLRPELQLESMGTQKHADLRAAIIHISYLRQQSPALQHGTYQQLFVASEQFAFLRQYEQEKIIVVVNACQQPVTVHIPIAVLGQTVLDLLNHKQCFQCHHGELSLEIPGCWGRVLKVLE
ncbi:alpha-amylase family glycosyl hydrolase [Agarivorans sp. QJM3NY_29]|uniref:alpha-amylase family glycosyl hydrolase n=1 Tax=unclassified Agarivorans TaxID=2636026 RepID=UPI003D7DAFF9